MPARVFANVTTLTYIARLVRSMLALRVRAVGSASAHVCQHEGHPLLRTAPAIATSGGMPASGLAALPARGRTSAAAGDRGSAGSVRTLNAIVPGDPPTLAVARRRLTQKGPEPRSAPADNSR